VTLSRVSRLNSATESLDFSLTPRATVRRSGARDGPLQPPTERASGPVVPPLLSSNWAASGAMRREPRTAPSSVSSSPHGRTDAGRAALHGRQSVPVRLPADRAGVDRAVNRHGHEARSPRRVARDGLRRRLRVLQRWRLRPVRIAASIAVTSLLHFARDNPIAAGRSPWLSLVPGCERLARRASDDRYGRTGKAKASSRETPARRPKHERAGRPGRVPELL
jgi:hypothetical protein